ADAHRLPFGNATFDNIVMFDVLHHLERPHLFFAEVSRVLKTGGRLVSMEPGITPVSHLFYTFFTRNRCVWKKTHWRRAHCQPTEIHGIRTKAFPRYYLNAIQKGSPRYSLH